MNTTIINFKKIRNEKVQILPHFGAFRLHATRTYKITENNAESIKSMLDNTSESDIFGMELILTKQERNITLFHTEQIDGYTPVKPILLSTTPDDLKKMNLYFLALQKPSCFPLMMNDDTRILDQLIPVTKLMNTEKVFVQIMIQKAPDSWKRKVENLYENYLTGIDHPANIKGLLAIQQKINELTNKVEGWNVTNKEIESLQQKLSEDGFRVIVKFGVYGEQLSQRERIANEVLKCFRKTDHHNSWCLSPVIFKKHDFIENTQMRRFPILHGKYQYLCSSELLPLLTIEESKQDIDPEKPTEEIVYKDENKTVRISYKLPSLSHLPKGSINNKDDDSKHEETLNKALERVGIVKDKKVHVVKVQQGATIKKVTFALPQGIKYSQVESAKKDIQNELGLSNISIDQGEKAGTVALSIPKDKRDKIYLRDLIDTKEFSDFARENPLPIVIGVSTEGKVLMACLSKCPHVLGAGATGSGKSVWLNNILLTLLLTRTPQELSIYIVDPKQVEFPQYKEFPHVQEVITKPERTLKLLESLTVEMENRYSQFAKLGCRNIKQYNKKSSKPYHYIVCIIDEFSDLIMVQPEIKDSIIRLTQLARACGIHVIIATQRPEVKVICGLIKANIPARVSFQCSSKIDYRTILDITPKFTLLGKGDGACIGFDGITEITRFQGSLIADGDEATDKVIEDVLNEWKAIMEGKETAIELPEPEQPLPEPTLLERAKFFICEERDTRVRSMQQHLKVSSQEIKRIYTELVTEGWLEEPTNPRSGYKILIDENSLSEFARMFVTQYCYSKTED